MLRFRRSSVTGLFTEKTVLPYDAGMPSDPAIPGLELFSLLPVAVYTTDAAGLLTFYNTAAAELWGLRPVLGEARWCGSQTLYRADMTPMRHDECSLAELLRDGRNSAATDAVARRPDGTLVSFRTHPRRLTDRNGRTIGVNTLVDLSPQKRQEESEGRFAAIVGSSDDAIVSKTLDGIVESWNAGAERLFGYTEQEAVGQSILLVIPPDRRHEEARIIDAIRQGLRVPSFETLRRHKDGRLIDVSLTVSPVMDRNGTVVGASKIARDITARKEAERRIHMLLREVNHRVKNQYSVILSMIRQTSRKTNSPQEFERRLRERIMALARSHDLLVQADWSGAPLDALVRTQVELLADPQKFAIAGPPVLLQPNAAQYLGIALHELATNAGKYGALSEPGGRIAVHWSFGHGPDGERTLEFSWEETGGPPVSPPSREGFGRIVLSKVTPAALMGRSSIDYRPAGLVWRLSAPTAHLCA